MRILIADAFPESGIEHLIAAGHHVDFQPGLTGAELGGSLADAEILVVRSTQVTSEAINQASDLSLIIRAGAGTNTIDKEAAARRAIFVSNVPGRNAIAVAELTMGLILSIDRRIPDNVGDLRAGTWNKKIYSAGRGLMGQRLGIVGLGAIGMAVATRAAAFDIELHGIDKDRDAATAERLEDLGFILHPDLAGLAKAVDIISFHVPATADTHHLVDSTFLESVRPGTVLINTSRSDVIDEPALLAALDEKKLWVGLDVIADEPAAGNGEVRSALAEHPRVYATHHIGASTAQSQAAVSAGVLEVIDAYTTGVVSNCVNLQPHVPDTTSITVRHLDQVGVLAAVLAVIRDAGLNVEHMTNVVFQGTTAAAATLELTGPVADGLIGALNAIPEVIHARMNA